MFTESVMSSNHLIFCHPFLLPSIFPSIKVFSNESALHIKWPKYWRFSFSISPSNEYSGLVSFRIGWFDLLAVQETLQNFLQHNNLKASVLQHSAFFIVQLSYLYMTTGKIIALGTWTFVGKVMSLFLNTLSRFVIAFLLRSKNLLISWLQSPSTVILEPKKIKSVTVSTFSPSICHEVMGLYLKKIQQPSVCFWEIPSLARVVTLYTQGKKPNGQSAVWWMLALKRQASHSMFREFAFQLLEGCQRLLFPRRSFPLHQWFPNLKVYAVVTRILWKRCSIGQKHLGKMPISLFFFCNWHATDIQCCIRSPYCWSQELLTLFRRPKKKFIPHSLYELSPPRSARVTPLRLYRRKHFHVTSLAPTTFMCFLSLCTVPYLIPLNLCRIYSKCSLIRNYLLIKYTSMSWIKADSRLRGQSSETHTGLIDCVILGKLLNLSGFFPFFSVPHEVAVNIRLKCPAHS